MAVISRKDVEHIARLARIELTEAEKKKFEKDLSGILEFVAKLNEADTSAVEPLTGGTALENVMRDDIPEGTGNRERGTELVDAAPIKRGGHIEVEAVFERD